MVQIEVERCEAEWHTLPARCASVDVLDSSCIYIYIGQ